MPAFLPFCIFIVFSCSLISCSNPQKTEEATANAEISIPKIDFNKLVEEAQILRDLEFERVPKLSRVAEINEKMPAEIVTEYTFLKDVFDVDLSLKSFARFDVGANVIEYQTTLIKLNDEHAIFRALISALDKQQNKEVFAAKTVDEYLATHVKMTSSEAFLSVLRQLKIDAPKLNAERVANRPQSWMKSELITSDLVSEFRFRNALVFGATMYRSNKIPGLEYGLSNGPCDSGSIKRPDRWLAGEGVGTWTLPKAELPPGFEIAQQGSIGPLFLEKWLGANPALSFWLSGAYRGYKADNEWLFEWVTMWETPTAASVAGKMLKDRFETEGKKGRSFSVVEFGNIVSVVGSFSDAKVDLENAKRAKQLAGEAKVVFPAVEKPFLNFVPTAFDRFQALKPQREGISAPGVVFDSKTLEGWKIETPKSGLWWYATLGKEAIIQCNVELKALDPPFIEDANYGEKWMSIFQSSVGDVIDADVKKLDWHGVPAWEIDMQGKRSDADATRRIISRQYAWGEFIVSVSLVSDPKDKTSVQTLKKLLESAKFKTP